LHVLHNQALGEEGLWPTWGGSPGVYNINLWGKCLTVKGGGFGTVGKGEIFQKTKKKEKGVLFSKVRDQVQDRPGMGEEGEKRKGFGGSHSVKTGKKNVHQN